MILCVTKLKCCLQILTIKRIVILTIFIYFQIRTYGCCTCNATSSPIKGTCLPFWGEGVVGVALNSSVGQKRWIYTLLPIQENIDLFKFKLYCSHSSFEHEKRLKKWAGLETLNFGISGPFWSRCIRSTKS